MRRKPTSTVAALLLSIGLGLITLGCPDKVVMIGAALPLTGAAAENYGVPIEKGVTLAIEQIQARGTYPHTLELRVVDTGSDPLKARELLSQLYSDGAVAVIGGVTSAEAKEMISEVDRYGRLLLSPSASNPELTGISRNFYRVCPSDFREANKMANFATQTLEISEIVVVAEKQIYAKGIQEVFQQEFERYDGKVIEVVEYPPNTSDYSGLAERVLTINPSAVYLAGFANSMASMISELRRLRYKGRILTGQSFAAPGAIAEAGDAAKGVILTQTVFDVDSDYAHIQSFVKAYKAKYDERPDLWAAHGYDAAMVLAEAMRESALPSEVLTGMRAISDFPGVTGSINFDEKGDAQKYPRVYIITEELLLADYSAEMERKREELRRKLEQLKRKAQQLDTDSSD